MAVHSRTETTTSGNLATYVGRALEATWLLTVALVPLIFVPTDFMLSEAVNAYVEVPKTTALRALAGVIVILWIVEWLLKGAFTRPVTMTGYLTRLRDWLVEQPSRWVVVAASAYMTVAIITTAFSQSFFISLWGEVSGQFGYSAYTTVSYFAVFAVVTTHLKTREQLYRLLTVLVATGFLVAAYGIVQRYEADPLNVGEAGSFRIASTMANSVFAGAALVGTTTLVLGIGRTVLETWGTSLGRAVVASLLTFTLVAAHLMAVWFTDARGSWLIGVPAGLVAILALPAIFDAFTTMVRERSVPTDLLVLVCLIILLTMAVLAAQMDVIGVLDFSGLPTVRTLAVLVGILGFLSLVVAMFPFAFSPGVRDFARTFLLMGSALMVTLLVVTFTYSPLGTVKLAFRDLGFLPDGDLLLALFGAMGLLGLVALVVRDPRAVLEAPQRWREEPPAVPVALRGWGTGLLSLGLMVGTAVIAATRPVWRVWDRFKDDIVGAARPTLLLAAVLVMALLVGGLVTTISTGTRPSTPAVAEGEVVTEPITSVEPTAPKQRGLSFRNDIWAASWRLVVNRTWFEYEDLSYSFVRPLIGYGPELFKYTFPLESSLGGLLSHAHNFFIHHAVEQGILGFFASLGLLISFFAVGLSQLWRSRVDYTAAHRWILIALLAAMVGRVAEMMVGVARESDLVTFWVMLATFVVLPSVMSPSGREKCPTCGEENEPGAESCAHCGVSIAAQAQRREEAQRPSTRRERRARRDRSARRAGGASATGTGPSPLRVLGISFMAVVIVFVGWLSWDKNVDYAWAAAIAATARDNFAAGDLQEGHRRMSRAIEKAPDVPIYYHNVSGILDAYRQFVTNNSGDFLQCQEFFPLEPREDRPQVEDPSFAGCAEESYLTNVRGYAKNKDSPQNRLILANSAMSLALLGYEGMTDVTLKHYRELTDMLPKSWHLEEALVRSEIRLGRYQEALDDFDELLAKAGGPGQRAQALHLQGLAHNALGQRQNAIDSFEKSLAEPSGGGVTEDVRRRLANAYDAQVVEHIQGDENDLALVALEKYLAFTDGSSEAARPLYLQGVVYQRMEEFDKALEVLQGSLAADEGGRFAADVHLLLSQVYTALGDADQAAEHTRLYQELKQG